MRTVNQHRKNGLRLEADGPPERSLFGPMDYTTFGNTGLSVSVMGVGCGGPSRVGQSTNKSTEESVAVIRTALDAGVNFIDTAEAYGTEEIVAQALEGYDRDQFVISTKKSYKKGITTASLREGLEDSLSRLRTDYVDIYSLHGVRPGDYAWLRDEIVPELFRLREEGKIQFIGVTEHFGDDNTHEMLKESLLDDVWDVVMVGFNILNQTARTEVFPLTQEKNVAVQNMFAVRRALSQPDKLAEALDTLVAEGELDPNEIDLADPFGFVFEQSDATSLVDASYRFCRYEPGIDVVLSGTGSMEHVKANIKSLSKPPLPDKVVAKLRYIFRNAKSVVGN